MLRPAPRHALDVLRRETLCTRPAAGARLRPRPRAPLARRQTRPMTVLMGLDARLRLARLYLITDARTKQGDLAEFLEAAFAGGGRHRADQAEGDVRGGRTRGPRGGARSPRRCCDRTSSASTTRPPWPAFHADMLHLGRPTARLQRPELSCIRGRSSAGRRTRRGTDRTLALGDKDIDYLTVGPDYATSCNPPTHRSGSNRSAMPPESRRCSRSPRSRCPRLAASTWTRSTR